MRTEELIKVVPHERQIAYQNLEFYAFAHFGPNTFSNREWGDGTEPEDLFNPTDFNADQWVASCKSAGMRGLILTCKHHDGYCLWPSMYTEHSVKNSPWCGGRGDVVREVSEACARGGIRFGVYLSPWDRNSPYYGDSPRYNDYYVAQLEELLTNYGEIFSVWFDGACGEGPNGKRQEYDWDRYYATIRRLQPNACIAVCGPDIRWCGNEAGHCRKSEWSVVPARLCKAETVVKSSQSSEADALRLKKIDSSTEDLGSRDVMADEPSAVWYPAEVNTSIRPGWFYHESEDARVRSLDDLWNVYLGSVGANATFLLNIPPDRRGRFADADVARLAELGEKLRDSFGRCLSDDAEYSSPDFDGVHTASALRADDENYFKTPDGRESAEITIKMPEKRPLRFVVLAENIRLSQRIEEFAVDTAEGSGWREVYTGTVVGRKRIAALPDGIVTDAVRVRIIRSRVSPTLSYISLY
jgi:alpha-L-fucosidase